MHRHFQIFSQWRGGYNLLPAGPTGLVIFPGLCSIVMGMYPFFGYTNVGRAGYSKSPNNRTVSPLHFVVERSLHLEKGESHRRKSGQHGTLFNY